MKFYTESSPHIKDGDTTNKIMLRVIIALLPAVIYSIVLFGARVIVLYLAAIITCIVSTIIVKKVRKKPLIPDYAVVVTAILLVMTLPPASFPRSLRRKILFPAGPAWWSHRSVRLSPSKNAG